MGSGKTTFGKKLANKLGVDHIDLDQEIENNQKKSINELFEERGEDWFRNLESQFLRQTAGLQAVISLGGGTPCSSDNMSFIKANGTSIYLEKPPKILIGRLKNAKDMRPLIAGKNTQDLSAYVQVTLKNREVYYQQADLVVTDINPKTDFVVEQLNSM